MMNDKVASPLIESLLDPSAYDHPVEQGVEQIETHISWVLLAGDFAYKIKKPLRNSFLDYSTLEQRHHYCEEELRLNRRFAPELYLDVVPITVEGGRTRVGGLGKRVEYAVRMRRFPSDELLSQRLNRGLVTVHDVRSLAMRIGQFHAEAEPIDSSFEWGSPKLLYAEAIDNCRVIDQMQIARTVDCIHLLRRWTEEFYQSHREHFAQRHASGHIRQCHGDLHLSNIVFWKGTIYRSMALNSRAVFIGSIRSAMQPLLPWTLRLTDAWDYCNSFINATFEASGDYGAVELLPWYLVYRTLVRAKVAAMRMKQLDTSSSEQSGADAQHGLQMRRPLEPDLDSLLDLAYRFTQFKCSAPTLWITYGLSGSGKTRVPSILCKGRGLCAFARM